MVDGPRRTRTAVAIAFVLVAGAATVIAATQRDDGDQVRTADASTSTTRSTTTIASTSTTTSSLPGTPGRPDRIAAVVDPDGDGSGSVAVLDGSSGRLLRTLAPAGASDVDIAPDGTIYYQTFAPELSESQASIVAIDPANGGQGTTYPSSWCPSVSPDGTRLARGLTDPFTTVVTNRIPTGPVDDVLGIASADRGGDSHALGDLAWSRDGTQLAVEIVDHHYYPVPAKPVPRVELVASRQSSLPVSEGVPVDVAGAASPVFAADGRLLVVADATGPESGRPIAGDRIVAWNIDTHGVSGAVSLPGASRLDASADGQWVVVTRTGQRPVVVAADGSLRLAGELPEAPEGIIAAAW